MSFKVCVSLLIFCLVDLSIGVSGVLKCPAIIALLLISRFILVSICLTYCGAPMDRSTKQKINKETQTLNDTIDQLDLIDVYGTFHPKTVNFTFISSTHGTFSRIDHILGHKSILGMISFFEFTKTRFMAQGVIYPGEGSLST